MPGFDKTGPMGQGPRTGGGFGLCTGAVTSEGYSARVDGDLRGVGRGGMPWGGGRGRCHGGGRKGFRNRGIRRQDLIADEAGAKPDFTDQIAQLIRESDDLRARIKELESKQ